VPSSGHNTARGQQPVSLLNSASGRRHDRRSRDAARRPLQPADASRLPAATDDVAVVESWRVSFDDRSGADAI